MSIEKEKSDFSKFYFGYNIYQSVLFVCFFIFGIISILAAEPTSDKIFISNPITFTSSNLPIIVINTHGKTIPDPYRIFVDMGIIYNGEGNRNHLTDSFNHYDGKINIETYR